ncbi:hypothetical protein AAFF_G00244550 [Aldrovandia affinis]|uniref:Uncharacterized protein n=1 Tax=Aldrovandia affinis TaxID=143900 RepID=A0AAD7RDV7_9TELE|nr:hypothetical protein AAFF_G00244550 [Aldrovandia affinis]
MFCQYGLFTVQRSLGEGRVGEEGNWESDPSSPLISRHQTGTDNRAKDRTSGPLSPRLDSPRLRQTARARHSPVASLPVTFHKSKPFRTGVWSGSQGAPLDKGGRNGLRSWGEALLLLYLFEKGLWGQQRPVGALKPESEARAPSVSHTNTGAVIYDERSHARSAENKSRGCDTISRGNAAATATARRAGGTVSGRARRRRAREVAKGTVEVVSTIRKTPRALAPGNVLEPSVDSDAEFSRSYLPPRNDNNAHARGGNKGEQVQQRPHHQGWLEVHRAQVPGFHTSARMPVLPQIQYDPTG